MLTFLIILTTVCALAVVYPYLLYPAILTLLPTKRIARGEENAGDGSRFSLLFCAYNESASMPAKIDNLEKLRLRYPKLEILAFDDGSNDGTAELIKSRAPFVKLMRGAGRNGKAHGMKLLAEKSTGELLIFTDANVLLDIEALDKLAACYADSSVGGVCGALHYLGADGSSTAAVGGLYWRLEEKIKDIESRTGSVMGADGSIFSIRKSIYPDFPDTVLDDFTVSMEAVFCGLRLIKSNDVVAHERLVSVRSDEFARKIRIAARAFHTHIVLSEKRSGLSSLDQFKYFSHKTIRWFGGAFLIVGFAAMVSGAALIHPVACAATVILSALPIVIGLCTPRGPFSSITEIVLAMLATLLGVTRALRGRTFATWNPAKSR